MLEPNFLEHRSVTWFNDNAAFWRLSRSTMIPVTLNMDPRFDVVFITLHLIQLPEPADNSLVLSVHIRFGSGSFSLCTCQLKDFSGSCFCLRYQESFLWVCWPLYVFGTLGLRILPLRIGLQTLHPSLSSQDITMLCQRSDETLFLWEGRYRGFSLKSIVVQEGYNLLRLIWVKCLSLLITGAKITFRGSPALFQAFKNGILYHLTTDSAVAAGTIKELDVTSLHEGCQTDSTVNLQRQLIFKHDIES